ncbi:DOC family protein [Penicillium malachiteum]|uniref:DOC family protein n=1 Tax=Penicillium malachiteum TaxID=1324776 RepID=UPI002548F6F9|nr:DOC family protein [Penicillium malachiteum]KAJ5731812.1 DOC family protein [Penicillium malachiteum]
MLRFLTVSQIQRLHARSVALNSVPVQLSMLESAAHSPMNMKHYAKVEDIFQLAANPAEKIMKNHAFQDGNKRTALLAADMFLKINGYYLQKVPFAEDINNRGLADAHVAVVTNQWTSEQLANYYKSVAAPLEPVDEEVLGYRSSAIEY